MLPNAVHELNAPQHDHRSFNGANSNCQDESMPGCIIVPSHSTPEEVLQKKSSVNSGNFEVARLKSAPLEPLMNQRKHGNPQEEMSLTQRSSKRSNTQSSSVTLADKWRKSTHQVKEQQQVLNTIQTLVQERDPLLGGDGSWKSWISSPTGEKVASCLIVANASCIWLETDLKDPDEFSWGWWSVGVAFVIWYCVEIVWRLWAAPAILEFFKVPANTLDFFLVVMGLGDSILEAMSSKPWNVKTSVLRTFRLLRLSRVVRLIKLIEDLAVMLENIWKAAVALAKMLTIIILFLFITAILCTQLVGHKAKAALDHLSDEEEPEWLAGPMVDSHEAMLEIEARFGTVLQSLFTLYHMTLGDEIGFGIRLTAAVEPFMWVILVCFSLFMTFAVLNLITGMIVETAFNASAKEKEALMEKKKIAERQLVEVGICHEIFKLADTDKSGWLTPEQYKEAFKNDIVKEKCTQLGLDIRVAEELCTVIDVNNDGEISLKELVRGFLLLRRGAQGDPVALLHRDLLWCHDLVHRDVLGLQTRLDTNFEQVVALAESDRKQEAQIANLIEVQQQQQTQLTELMSMQAKVLDRLSAVSAVI